jgi:hypothetical protein
MQKEKLELLGALVSVMAEALFSHACGCGCGCGQ